jgi:hypothetical protein
VIRKNDAAVPEVTRNQDAAAVLRRISLKGRRSPKAKRRRARKGGVRRDELMPVGGATGVL